MVNRQAGSLLQIRMDERLRYLTDLALAATGKTLTEFVSSALEEKFAAVSLYKRPTFDRIHGVDSTKWTELYDPAEAAEEREALNLARQADLLWSESKITRIEMLELIAPHLVKDDDQAILDFIRTFDEYKIYEGEGYKLNRKKIDSEWEVINARFAARPKTKSKKGTTK